MGPIRSARTACLLAALVLAAAGCGSGGDAGAPAPAGEQAATTTSATAARQGADRVLGRGFVTGSGTAELGRSAGASPSARPRPAPAG
jgi:hypothetical protein